MNNFRLKFIKYIILIIVSITLSGCATIFLPNKQKITFNVNTDKTQVFLGNELIGDTTNFIAKIEKDYNVRQLVLRKKGYKDVNEIILKSHRPLAYYPLATVSILMFYVPFIADQAMGKSLSFDKEIKLNLDTNKAKLNYRENNQKYINASDIYENYIDEKSNISFVSLTYDPSKELLSLLEEAEKNNKKKKVNNANSVEIKTIDENKTPLKPKINFDDNIAAILKKTNYIDTLNTIFHNENNTLSIGGKINNVTYYKITSKYDNLYTGNCSFSKAKINITWYLKNNFDEISDSINCNEFSGNFESYLDDYDYRTNDFSNKLWNNLLGDAVVNSFLQLHTNAKFKTAITKNKDVKNDLAKLILSKSDASTRIIDKKDAFKATVIVKTKNGHGSGFAISKDGYILTNYHVIASNKESDTKEITIFMSNGLKIPAKVVRFNRFKDVALLKVDSSFDKFFDINNENKSELMQDIFTIGAPKSVELGQSVSAGIISNFRESNEVKLMQLGIAVNSGNSGGPIFDLNGNLHGILVSKLVGLNTEGVAFGIPSYLIQDYLSLEVK